MPNAVAVGSISFPDVSLTSTGMKMDWVAPAGNVDGYSLSVKTGGTDITGSPFALTVLTKTLTGLTAATTYSVGIKSTLSSPNVASAEATKTVTTSTYILLVHYLMPLLKLITAGSYYCYFTRD